MCSEEVRFRRHEGAKKVSPPRKGRKKILDSLSWGGAPTSDISDLLVGMTSSRNRTRRKALAVQLSQRKEREQARLLGL